MPIQWDESLRLGVPAIDKQHEEIFVYFNKLTDAIQKGAGRSVVIDILAYLDYYVSNHFSEEELTMEDCKYPYIEEQCEQHSTFKGNITTLSSLLNTNGPTQEISLKLDAELIRYFINHVHKLDKALADYIKLQTI